MKLAVVTGRKEHAAHINAAWQKGVDAVIETGLRIIDAREGLEHGEFEEMVRNDLHVSPGTARKLLAIASNKVIANRSHVNDLPASWGTLYELTSAENKGLDLEAGIASGAIHPKMERKDVKALLPPPQRDDDLEEPDDTVEEPDDRRDHSRDCPCPMCRVEGTTAEEATNPLAFAWENASREERASFLHGLGREVLLEALAAIDATDKRTTVQRIADRAEARSAAAAEPKRRGRPPGSKNKQKTIAIDETIEVVAPTVADDFGDTLAARMRQGESAGAPDDPFEIPPMFDRTGGTP